MSDGTGLTRGRVALGVAALLVVGGGAATVPLLHPFGVATPSPAGSASPSSVPPTSSAPAVADEPLAVGSAFLAAWQRSDYPAMQALVADKTDDMVRVYGGMADRLKIASVVATPGALNAAGTMLPFQARLSLTGLGDLSYAGIVHLTRPAGHWRVAFTSDTVYPGLVPGQRLALAAGPRTPAPILDRAGRSLAGDRDLTANLLGSAGDPVSGAGASGLYRVLQSDATAPASTVAVVNVTTGATERVVKAFGAPTTTPQPGVRTTLDLTIQRAAAKALAKAPGTAALVAIDTATGEVRALVNKPVTGLPAAIAGAYPPGSTFKIITATAALLNGVTPATDVPCPATITAGGVRFRNHEQAKTATLSLTQAFAQSCNTAFIHLAAGLPAGALSRAAELYGFNGDSPLPIASVAGSIPEPASDGEAAADAIGQGRVTASPLQMASVAAAAASGTWRQPHVLPCPDCASHAVPVAASLRPMMRAVVTSGTGTRAAGVPGGPVYGKTGTAEFGTGATPPTHAWFIGYQGGLAFAVFVDRGSTGGAVAAPIAAAFLRSLA